MTVWVANTVNVVSRRKQRNVMILADNANAGLEQQVGGVKDVPRVIGIIQRMDVKVSD